MNDELVLVTGGSGFIASHCMLKLLDAGYRVRTTVRSLEREAEVRAMLREGGAEPGDRLSFVAADLTGDAGWAEAVAGCAYVALVKLGVAQPKIAVSGLNPHAGESGAFGREEIEVIDPALQQARREGIVADGPVGADTLVQRAGYDAYVVMLHDQGHVAAKALAPRRIAALALGTPVLFSSVGHGSALDIAGQGRADATAMNEAIARLVGGF